MFDSTPTAMAVAAISMPAFCATPRVIEIVSASIAHMNADHTDAMVLYRKALSKATEITSAIMTGIDRNIAANLNPGWQQQRHARPSDLRYEGFAEPEIAAAGRCFDAFFAALAATSWPARRAAAVDPSRVLRSS